MRFVHTFCGKSSVGKSINNSFYNWMYALSALYVKQNANVKMILYTDSIGGKILEPIKYLYDEVHTIAVPSSINPIFFAAIKAYALQKEPLGSIYLDGDVFLKTKDTFNRLLKTSKNTDCITQGLEVNVAPYYEVGYYNRIGYKFDHEINHTIPCNTGILGFFNAPLRCKYINHYIKAAKAISAKGDFEGCGIPDIVLEQSYLSALVREEGYRMGEVVTGVNFTTVNRFAKQIGLCHMWGSSKYRHLPVIKVRLRELNEKVYNNLMEIFGNDSYDNTNLGEL